HTAPAPDDMEKVYELLLEGGEAGVKARVADLVGMLVEPGVSEDYKARYLLHALVIGVTRPGPDGEPTPVRRAVGEALVKALADATTPNVKSYLVAELQFMGERKAIPAIGKLLTDAALCDTAARALVTIGDGSPEELRRALPEVSGRSRLMVMQALGELRDADAVDELTPLLRDASADVRLAAAAALAKIAEPRAVAPLTEALEAAKGHERVLMADPCFALARKLLDSDERGEAFEIYGRVWRILSGVDEPQMRHAIVAGLAEGYASDTTSALVRKLRTRAPATRAAALHALRERADPEAFPAVAKALGDPDPWVRIVAIAAIGPVGGARSVPLLVKALPGEDPAEEQALRAALLAVEGEGANASLAEGLAAVKEGPDAEAVRLVLLDTIATRRATEGKDAALALVGAESAEVRMSALKAMAKIADGDCAPRLVELARELTDQRELKALEDALVESCRKRGRDSDQVEPVAAALGQGSVASRRLLLRVVGRIGARASVTVLVDATRDAEKDVRDAAVRSLADFPNDKPTAELLRIAKSAADLTHKVLALRGYVRMAEMKRDNREKVSMMKEAISLAERDDERKHVLGRLGNIHAVESLEAVLPYVGREKIANEAGRAAYNIARRIERKNRDAVRKAMEKVIATARDKRLLNDAKGLLKKVR
ncbi:MAG: HEAT repeat domain-containing protein, partial [Planctomycetota bacterium]